ncbi:NAD(P)/FAD-dependent oxidoreductase [Serratia odorifera]|uniref:FAD dependent oxidoreductase n=2 Tax=Serratia odorifera TaxID=618 RepID=D4E698_SEROD|nr:FAD-dependent oxidoreductase [Serratia odorifera]EFE94827.1 FAD dependent oxidoreductase [Serratia odorifera DSM 4582]PNK89476.1 FAD-binding oxidoreductase [Serratia odorifera]RII70938.1 FAD-binding oxidoreductase [Serratia odorifera]VDZ63232.1 Gamma-glutamylputrescine oxidoreductase [Serratia odorifera]
MTHWLANATEACIYPQQVGNLAVMPRLDKVQEADVVVIGGGLLGLSAALHLAAAGVDTVLLEKAQVGGRASGRNGGQLTPGMARWKARQMLQMLPFETARWLWQFASSEAMQLLDSLLETHGINADRHHGHLTAAVHPAHMAPLAEELAARQTLGDRCAAMLDREQLRTHLNSANYHGAAIDHSGGHIHPLKLVHGLLGAFLRAGGQAYEDSAVVALRPGARGTLALTAAGGMVARKAIVLAMHADSGTLQPQEESMTLPLYTYVAATAPVSGGIHTLLPTAMPVYDTQLQIDYFRPYDNDRLLFGALGTSQLLPRASIVKRLQQRLTAVFPQQPNLSPEFFWAEPFDITRSGMPVFRKSAAPVPVYSAYGWNGHGLAQSVRVGKAISDDLLRLNRDFLRLTRFPPVAFPTRFLSKRRLASLAMLSARVVNLLQPHKMLSS